MRLYTEHTEAYIHTLAATVSKDPASLDAWRCMHLHPTGERTFDIAAIRAVKELHKALDCDVVLCPDGDLLIISRDVGEEAMDQLAAALAAHLGNKTPEVTLYELFADWRRIRVLLMSKAPAPPEQMIDPLAQEDLSIFGELGSMSELFASAKRLRKARQPQYVMLVEDDPITRRIVTNSFKENYALITACDAHDAIANYLMYAPDVVFLDIGLPSASGFTVLRQIVASDPDAYVVMFSGNSYLDNITKAFAGGASGFIAKPFKREKLRRYIEDSALHHRKSSLMM